MRPGKMMVGLISIHKDNLVSVKMEIYHQTMKVITKSMSNHKLTNINNEIWFFYLILGTSDWLDIIALKSIIIKSLLIIYANKNVQKYHFIIADISVNYKK